MMKNLGQMMKQAQQMQENMKKMQDELASAEMTGQSAAGMITVTVTGKGEVKGLEIDPSLIKPDEKEVLEDLIVAAMNDARAKVDEFMREKTQEAMGGLQLPEGMQLPF